jgi:hypothetical protein
LATVQEPACNAAEDKNLYIAEGDEGIGPFLLTKELTEAPAG